MYKVGLSYIHMCKWLNIRPLFGECPFLIWYFPSSARKQAGIILES